MTVQEYLTSKGNHQLNLKSVSNACGIKMTEAYRKVSELKEQGIIEIDRHNYLTIKETECDKSTSAHRTK